MVVVGAEEQRSGTVNIRNRDDPATQKQGELVPVEVALEKLVRLRDQRRLRNSLDADADGEAGQDAVKGS